MLREETQTQETTPESRHDMLRLHIADHAALHDAYMDFIADGGLFVPTARDYALGDRVFVLLRLFDDPEPLPLATTVVWLTPHHAQSQRAQGIGLRFDATDNPARARIEHCLAGHFDNARLTHTL
ncbi:MAG TPA: PilZ domain-containing protein [Hyphomicrobiales bacterium]|nr:PilZ domain-containing protein [Hyphomicrobiales bacterium]